MTESKYARNVRIRTLQAKGLTLRGIALLFNITYQRVQQICNPKQHNTYRRNNRAQYRRQHDRKVK